MKLRINLNLILTCNIYVVVQFYPWFNFYFPLFQTHYHILPCPKTKENKNETKDKIEPQHIRVIVVNQAACSAATSFTF